jgi:hypothetical protein
LEFTTIMNAAELKNHLHKLIVETDDLDILTKIQLYFKQLKSKNTDWWDALSETTKKEIELSIKQSENGTLISHAEARKKIDRFFGNHE